jgi:hypothetical protein
MPTHQDLLNAEVAFILYNGQVYMSHPTDNDVSLTKLVTQAGELGHLDKPLVEAIHEYLRGGDIPPELQLVGRYNLSNGRMAPYGPVNSTENQEQARQAIQQAAYSSPETPQEPVSGDPTQSMARTLSKASEWRIARQFMPLVYKATQDDCPFCGQKRSLYHMKDNYLAQNMGVYGHPLCRDCLTTRMDQHEATTGQRIAKKIRLSNFRLVAADIRELATKMLTRLYKEQNFTDPYHTPYEDENKTRAAQRFVDLMDYLLREAPETYKLWPFIFRSFKKDNVGGSTAPAIIWADKSHVKDILQQATIHSERMKDDPRPEVRVPNFMAEMKPLNPDEVGDNPELEGTSWHQLQNWVYDQNKINAPQDEADAAEEVVFEWPDGWTIKKLGPEALGREGELMGHCVGGYCTDVRNQNSHIYSLRDEKNQPHVTFEVEGQVAYAPHPTSSPFQAPRGYEESYDKSIYENGATGQSYRLVNRPALSPPPRPNSGVIPSPRFDESQGLDMTPQWDDEWPSWKIIQIQGKQDREPIPEYRKRINEFISWQRQAGVKMDWHPTEAIRPGGEDEDYIADISDVMDYWEDYENGNYNSHDYPSINAQNKDKKYDEYGLPHADFEGALYVSRDGLEDIVEQAVSGYTQKEDRWRRDNYLDVDPDDLIRAIMFLVSELKIQGKTSDSGAHMTGFTNWDDALTKAIEHGWEKIDKERDELRDMNWEYTHDMNYNAWQQAVQEDPENLDPNEIDYEHPYVEESERWIDEELNGPWKRAIQFIQDLQSAHAGMKPGEEIPTAPADVQKQIDADPDIGKGIPGALGSWHLVL